MTSDRLLTTSPWISMLAVLACLACIPAVASGQDHSAGGLMVGAGRADISPIESTILGGYGIYFGSLDNCRWSQGVHDPIYATAIYISKGDGELLLISLDLVGLMAADMDDIKAGIADRYRIDPGRVIIACTHTHHAPDTMGLWGTIAPAVSGRSEKYMTFMKAKVVEAAGAAYESRGPARLYYSVGEIRELHFNHYEGTVENPPIDHALVVLKAVDENDKTIATVMNWGCHPTTEDGRNRLVSSDWVGVYYREMEARGAGIPMFLNGSIGASIQPSEPWRDERVGPSGQGFLWAEAMGKEVADAVSDRMSDMTELEFDRIEVASAPAQAEFENRMFRLAKWFELIPFDPPRRHRPFTTRVTQVRIGGLGIATAPGELSPQLGMMIREAIGGDAQMIVGLSQDYLGYIIDEAQWDDKRYGYERMLCMGPGLGMALVEAHRRLAERH